MDRAIGSTLQPDQDTAAGLGQETSLLNSGTLPSGASHEPGRLRVGDPRSGPRLCEAQRFMWSQCAIVRSWKLPMNLRKWHRHLACSGLTGWKPVPLCSRRPGSWPQLTSNFWRGSLSMNRNLRPRAHPRPRPRLADSVSRTRTTTRPSRFMVTLRDGKVVDALLRGASG